MRLRAAPSSGTVASSIFGLLRLAVAGALLAAATDWRSPLLASYRTPALIVLVAAPVLLIVCEIWLLHRRPQAALRVWLFGAVTLIAATAWAVLLVREGRFQWQRAEVLAADPGELEGLGRHVIVGYRDPSELRLLLQRRAIGGVFVGARNVAGLSPDDIRNEIASWQALRRRQGLAPLLIASDQEGGVVSRLSPPLPRQPPLAAVVANAGADGRADAAYAYGLAQGRALADIGITVNFAPVVDIDRKMANPGDRHTRISQRAIAADPAVITAVAGRYCAGLAAAGVRCTLKHFPGLGDVFEDTHLEAGYLRTPLPVLAAADWVPFRALMGNRETLTMLGHARLTGLDAEHPASFSQAVVAGLLRRDWGHDGVLITDDFSMYAVYSSREGVDGASVAALSAGIDLLLVAYDPALYFPAMAALLAASRAGGLPAAALAASRDRLQAISVNH
ncbi:MAG: glycoside hydrolase family 3 protein [Hyphomicrobiales bacterium]|nr:glycoside hydrolase family 3 protein [Hyphomicrobiales bacterium]